METLHLKYDALIFDMDGTLADTMPIHYVAWSRTLSAHGIDFSEDRFYALGGVPAPSIIEMLAAEQGVEMDPAAVAHEKEMLFIELLQDVAPVAPVLDVAARHRDKMPMAIATGSPSWVAEKVLGDLGVRAWFQVVVGAESVGRPKPAPDTYLRAATLLEVEPSRCHAFEDTLLGVESARNAGMTVVNVVDHFALRRGTT